MPLTNHECYLIVDETQKVYYLGLEWNNAG